MTHVAANPLYQLEQDAPQRNVAFLHEFYTTRSSDDIIDDLIAKAVLLLIEEQVEQSVADSLIELHEVVPDGSPFRGPVGLLLGLHFALRYTLAHEDAEQYLNLARRYFADPPTLSAMARLYEIDAMDYDILSAELHRIGTTSIIFRCSVVQRRKFDERSEVALKVLLPRYMTNRAISAATLGYQDLFRRQTDYTPRVYESTRSMITMRFVEGQTLAELFAQRQLAGAPDRVAGLKRSDIAFIRDIGTTLCRALASLSREGYTHLDLNPSNIIVTNDHPGAMAIQLVDFGRNYAITERVATSLAFQRAALYVAPELLDPAAQGDGQADLYSIGIILLESAVSGALNSGNLYGELDRLWQGEEPWEGAPQIARIIDDLIDADPEKRLLLRPTSAQSGEERLKYLADLIERETTILSVYESRSVSGGYGLLRGRRLIPFGGLRDQIRNLVETSVLSEGLVDKAPDDSRRLAPWAKASVLSWSGALTLFIILTLADLKISGYTSSVQNVVSDVHSPVHVGRFWHNLPGRLVGLTFAMSVLTYYMNDYSIVSTRGLPGKWARWSEFFMRSSAIVLTFPIYWTLAWNPDDWPLCSGIGSLLIVANNYATYRFASDSESSSTFSIVRNVGRRFLKSEYSEWWNLMLFYAISMITVGILLKTHVAHDEAIYAYLVSVVNIVKMYRLNCISKAPLVRGTLLRSVLFVRRLNAQGF